MAAQTISINRAPVLTVWAALVAQRIGSDEVEALNLGKAEGRRLDVFKCHEETHKARAKGREDFGGTTALPRISRRIPRPGHVPG